MRSSHSQEMRASRAGIGVNSPDNSIEGVAQAECRPCPGVFGR